MRGPPRSPLFPYTTLFRSVGPLGEQRVGLVEEQHRVRGLGLVEDLREVLLGLADVLVDDLREVDAVEVVAELLGEQLRDHRDRKSTRLNSSHPSISYAVFC